MKTLFKTLVASMIFAAGVAAAGETPRQLYAPIDRIYTVEEARNLSLFKRLAGEGVPMAELEQPGAFVETYSDTSFGMHKLHRTAYIPAPLREGVTMNTIIAVNRYDRTAIVNEVVPRTLTAAYDCINSSGFSGIANCAEDAVKKTKAVSITMD